MSSHQPLVALVVLAAIAHQACDRAGSASQTHGSGTVTLVNRVSASVQAEHCPTCASTLESALIERLNAVDVSVNLERQTITMEFPPGSPFASRSFREAVKESGGEVQRIEIEACGTIDTSEGQAWLKSGSTRLLLDGSGPFVTGGEVCVTGELVDSARPPRLVGGQRTKSPS